MSRIGKLQKLTTTIIQTRVLLLLSNSSRTNGSIKRALLGAGTDATRGLRQLAARTFSSLDSTKGATRESRASGPVTLFVEKKIQSGQLRRDPEQLLLASRLDDLHAEIVSSDRGVLPPDSLSLAMFEDAPRGSTMLERAQFWMQKAVVRSQIVVNTNFTKQSPRGIYIHGSVGVGKSLLMDVFCDALHNHYNKNTAKTASSSSNKVAPRGLRRVHFHEFMLDVHASIHQVRKQFPKQDPIPAVALALAKEARILCFDEFQVTDIADAMVLKRLFTMLWNGTGMIGGIGMVVVATSNRSPQQLYEGGLNRDLFVPFIDIIRENMDVIQIRSDRDYRREQSSSVNTEEISYFYPAGSTQTQQALKRIFARGGDEAATPATVKVRMGRQIVIPRSNDTCAWFNFDDLCAQPLGAADYLALCERYTCLIIDHVPQLTAEHYNEARRFVTLVDAAYECKVRMVLASSVPLHALFVNFEVAVETHDGDEEIGVEGVGEQRKGFQSLQGQTFVKGEGGSSSSSSTTMVKTKDGNVVEWSATGRIGVSLAHLSAVRDVSFSFARAESRLIEMNNGVWVLKPPK